MGFGAGFAVTATVPEEGVGGLAFPDFALAERVTCLPGFRLLGTVTTALSSLDPFLARFPSVHVVPLAAGQTVNLGATTVLPAWPLTVTLTPVAAPESAQTQIA